MINVLNNFEYNIYARTRKHILYLIIAEQKCDNNFILLIF